MKIALFIGSFVASLAALGSVFLTAGCTSTPPRHWLTHLEIEARLRETGLALQSLRADSDRCFAVVVRDAQGNQRSLIVNPADGLVVREVPEA